jgi:hypothetical protein
VFVLVSGCFWCETGAVTKRLGICDRARDYRPCSKIQAPPSVESLWLSGVDPAQNGLAAKPALSAPVGLSNIVMVPRQVRLSARGRGQGSADRPWCSKRRSKESPATANICFLWMLFVERTQFVQFAKVPSLIAIFFITCYYQCGAQDFDGSHAVSQVDPINAAFPDKIRGLT